MKKLLILVATLTVAQISAAETIDLGIHGQFDMAVPVGWTFKSAPAGNVGVNALMKPGTNDLAKCTITIAYNPKPIRVDVTSLSNRELDIGAQLVDNSVEKNIDLKNFTLTKGIGVYFVITDSSLVGLPHQPDNFKVLCSGLIQVSPDETIVVSMFYDDPKGQEAPEMLKAVSSITITKGKALQ